ncbi:carbohydrate ABC transporter permease [Bacillus sp. UNC41MFS5]|uniref:carbohydrate ABC transporter permease n=1 Tax=Bacillus sp. UNC41MFS5 TaxID=1449046 RepID=UPI000A430665|nr:sugar ABC transporter permease [Bacillus sp. UNC41MFS5]
MSSSMVQIEKKPQISTETKKKINMQKVAPYIFVSPFIIVFALFSLYPFINSIIMSFQRIEGINETTFIGLQNYQRLITDPVFYKALWNVAIYTFWTILILIPLPLILAIVMNHENTKFKSLFRSVFFLPVLTSTVIVGLVFKFAFSKEATGVFNSWLGHFNIGPIDWLNGSGTGMFALVLVCVWRWMGVNMIYFLSGLQSIPKDLYECAEIDGATTWVKFKHITLPMVKPITTYVLTISILGGFSLFNETYVYWGAASPDNIGTTFLTYIYKSAFSDGDLGYACTLGVAMFVIVVVINLIQVSVRGLFKED